MHSVFDKNDLYARPRLGKKGTIICGHDPTKANPELVKTSFLLTHYAGEVCYTASDWLEKNRGKLPIALARLLAASSAPMIAELISPLEQAQHSTAQHSIAQHSTAQHSTA